ncbi:hypothetical protein C8R46DRAFT_1310984 [Mycena filopes]|nr:hypothetical protein C8R46DRAFT_1310984 [Mycena filopes]
MDSFQQMRYSGSRQFTPAFVAANPGIFLDLDWVHPAQLRAFLARDPSPPSTVRVKTEAIEPAASASRIKTEPSTTRLPPRPRPIPPIRTRRFFEDDHETTEILSSEDEMEVEAVLRPSGASSDPPAPSSPPLLPSSDPELSDDELTGAAPFTLSTTSWYDPAIISRVVLGDAAINRQNKLKRVEYLDVIPSYFPVFREPTAIVIDMRDPKFDFYDKDGVLLAPDALILDQNPTRLPGSSAAARVTRATAVGGAANSTRLDPSLVNVTRYELDTSTRAKVVSAEVATRLEEGDSPEKLVAAFHRVITGRKCKTKDSIGAPCDGHPMMKALINGSLRRSYFIGCSNWTPTWRDHQSDSIPDNIDETLLAELMSPRAGFSSGSSTAPCSRIGSSRVGERQKFCAHIHLKDGKSVRAPMIHHLCNAYMTIYVPVVLAFEHRATRQVNSATTRGRAKLNYFPLLRFLSLVLTTNYVRGLPGSQVMGPEQRFIHAQPVNQPHIIMSGTKFASFDTLVYEENGKPDSWPTWESQAQSALVLNNSWGYVSGRGVITPPKQINDSSSPPIAVDNPQYDDWLDENLIVISCLRLRWDIRLIKDEKIAKAAWLALKVAHQPTGALSQLTVLQQALAIRYSRETRLVKTTEQLDTLVDSFFSIQAHCGENIQSP